MCPAGGDLLSGQGVLPVGGSALVEREAQRLFAQLLAWQSAPVPRAAGVALDVQSLGVDWLEFSRPRTVGLEAVGLWALAQVDFLNDVYPHDLRRTFGSWLVQAGVGIERVSELLRHGDVAITARVHAHL